MLSQDCWQAKAENGQMCVVRKSKVSWEEDTEDIRSGFKAGLGAFVNNGCLFLGS